MKNYLTLEEGFRKFAEKYSKILNSYFKDKIVSGEVHMRKPDKEIFTYTLERLGCDAKQCIFVDNSVSNLLVAEELGIQTILFNRDDVEYEGRIVDDFEALGNMLAWIGADFGGEKLVMALNL